MRKLAPFVLIASTLACGSGSPPPAPPVVLMVPAPTPEPPRAPLVDTDCDRIPDEEDHCPREIEDRDGFQDEDGCPDPDNDGDGIVDACDACPSEPETRNDFEDDDGCPDTPGRVIIIQESIRIIPRVLFDRQQTTPKKEAKTILDEVANVMKSNPQVEKIAIVGHASGDEAGGEKLSEARARKVMEMLVSLGVEPARMETHGAGSKRPIANELRPEDRAKNRRVEFELMRVNGRNVGRWSGTDVERTEEAWAPAPKPSCTQPPPPPFPEEPCWISEQEAGS